MYFWSTTLMYHLQSQGTVNTVMLYGPPQTHLSS
jgi:hypothetical protein